VWFIATSAARVRNVIGILMLRDTPRLRERALQCCAKSAAPKRLAAIAQKEPSLLLEQVANTESNERRSKTLSHKKQYDEKDTVSVRSIGPDYLRLKFEDERKWR
jgi:hypothetical protein